VEPTRTGIPQGDPAHRLIAADHVCRASLMTADQHLQDSTDAEAAR
jgi:hypothetical protein